VISRKDRKENGATARRLSESLHLCVKSVPQRRENIMIWPDKWLGDLANLYSLRFLEVEMYRLVKR